MPETSIHELVTTLAQQAAQASLTLATTPTAVKNQALEHLATLIEERAETLVAENEKDLAAGRANGLSQPLLDRLTLTPARIHGMAQGVRQVAALPDPVGETIEHFTRPNGIHIHKIRVPIGVIGIIYESRPNVTIDCAALCLKSGNASILRGGKEAIHSNRALAGLLGEALQAAGMPAHSVQLIPTTDREALNQMIRMDAYIDCIIPRGGEGLIRFVAENGTIPVIKHYTGVCSAYIDVEADFAMAREITVNAKCQRPGVCNAIENLFVHQDTIATEFPAIARALVEQGVELRVDAQLLTILHTHSIPAKAATEEDYRAEFLDRILAVKTVESVEAAIDNINRYGSKHSDAIITRNQATAQKFLTGVDSATVYWNASTRFTDGFEFGLGAEIGISTDKLHARGPMGLRELCTYKYAIYGNGQIRQ